MITIAEDDDGYGDSYPAASHFATKKGDNKIERAKGNNRDWTERERTGTGNDCSLNEPKKAWHTENDYLERERKKRKEKEEEEEEEEKKKK